MTLGKQIVLLIGALCLSTAIGSFLWAIMLGLYYTVLENHTIFMQLKDLEGFVYLGLLSNFYAIPASLLFGIPSFFLLRKFRLFKWWSICIVGAIAGGLIGKNFPFGIIWPVMLGLISASIAWLLIARSNKSIKFGTPKSGAP